MVQWLRLSASNAGGVGLIPHQGIKIPQATVWAKKKKDVLKLDKIVSLGTLQAECAIFPRGWAGGEGRSPGKVLELGRGGAPGPEYATIQLAIWIN